MVADSAFFRTFPGTGEVQSSPAIPVLALDQHGILLPLTGVLVDNCYSLR